MARRTLGWEIALAGVALVWGATFVTVQDAVERIPPMLFVALRFALAAAVMGAAGAFRGLTRADARDGAAIGLALFGGYAFQTVGLQYTTASNAGFITGLFVVFTPLLGAAVLRRLPTLSAGAGVALATAGLVLLAMPEGFRVNRGDALVLACALSFATHIVLLGRLAPGRSPARLAAVQCITVAALSGLTSATAERAAPAIGADVWWTIALTGIVASALAFFVQTAAQRVIPPTRTAIILTAEPVFAGVFGYLLAGEVLTARGYLGAALILAGILAAELLAPEREAV